MIRNQWYVVLESREIGAKPKHFRRLGEDLVFWREPGVDGKSGQVRCLLDLCCHRGVALSTGRLVPAGTSAHYQGATPKKGEIRLQCPFHGLEYDGDGRCTCIPANSRNAAVPSNFQVRSYPVHEDHGFIWIWWGKPNGDGPHSHTIQPIPAGKEKPEFFNDIPADMVWTTAPDPWKAHYSRVIENQLDMVHVPFVHYNTIGKGGQTVVDGPGIQWINDRLLYTYVFNRLDDGTPPKKPSEVPVPPPGVDYKLEFLFPNLWENRIADKLRVLAAFVPVDNENTILYLRFYQNFMKIPGLLAIFNFFARRTNLKIAHQDRVVVQTQVPKPSSLRGGENLLQGDLSVIEYRKRRQQLLDAAEKA